MFRDPWGRGVFNTPNHTVTSVYLYTIYKCVCLGIVLFLFLIVICKVVALVGKLQLVNLRVYTYF